jgi:hypothetical protein
MSKISLKESLFLGFCAVFVLLSRGALRLHLGISGHAMFSTMFFLLIARGCVPRFFSATITGLFAGVAAMALGMGKGGPLLLMKFVLPALVVDLGAAVLPLMFQSYLLCALVAAIASATKFIDTYVVDLLVSMNQDIILQHAFLEAGPAVLFGVAGGLFVPPVIRRLKAYGVI